MKNDKKLPHIIEVQNINEVDQLITKKDLIKFLKENLTLENEVCGGEYGSRRYMKIDLNLGDVELSTIYFDLE